MIILAAFFYCFLTIGIQIVIWNLKKPTNEINFLFLYLLLIPIFLSLPLILFQLINDKNLTLVLSDILLYFFFSYSFNAFYLITFTGIQENSPSLLLIHLIHINKKNNINDIKKDFKRIRLIEPRVIQLIRDGVVIERDNQLSLSTKGQRIYVLNVFFRKIFNVNITS